MSSISQRLPATWRLAYLGVVVISLFAVPSTAVTGAVILVQAVLWFGDGFGFAPLKRTVRRLALFVAVITLSYAFVSVADQRPDLWLTIPLGPWSVAVNFAGLAVAVEMCLRVIALVWASLWVQRGCGPGEFVAALRSFRVPQFLALAIDGTLRLVAGAEEKKAPGSGAGGGRGRGGGRHRGRRALEAARLGFAEIRQGRLTVVTDLVDRALARAEAFVAEANPGLKAEQARDIAIVAGIATAIMGLKLIQVLPGLPVAPGHKNLIIIPFFLLAAGLTRARFGGLWTGLTVGAVSVLMGYGKYGVLEIAHFAVPGLMADLLLPLTRRSLPTPLKLLQYSLIGVLLGVGRFAANFLVIVLAGAPLVAFYVYLPMLASQAVFGGLSGLVSLIVLDRLSGRREAAAEGTEPTTTAGDQAVLAPHEKGGGRRQGARVGQTRGSA